jgi:hypothetical protein
VIAFYPADLLVGADGHKRPSVSTADVGALARRKSRSGLGVFTYEEDEGSGQQATPTRKRSGTSAAEAGPASFSTYKYVQIVR